MIIPLDQCGVRLISLFIIIDFVLFIKNCIEYYLSDEIFQGDKIYFVGLYGMSHFLYFCAIIPFITYKRCKPDNYETRVRMRRSACLLMSSAAYTICVLIFAFYVGGDTYWLTDADKFYRATISQVCFLIIYIYLMGVLNRFAQIKFEEVRKSSFLDSLDVWKLKAEAKSMDREESSDEESST